MNKNQVARIQFGDDKTPIASMYGIIYSTYIYHKQINQM